MPPWFDKKGCTLIEGLTDVYLNFSWRCSCGETKQSVCVGKAIGVDKAAKLAAAFVKKRGTCQGVATTQTAEEAIAAAQAEIVRLDKAVVAQKKRAGQFDAENGVVNRKVAEGKALKADAAVEKRLKTST
jgi:hypothetical protein